MKSKGLVVLAVLAILLCFASLAYFIPKIQKTNQVYSLLKTYAHMTDYHHAQDYSSEQRTEVLSKLEGLGVVWANDTLQTLNNYQMELWLNVTILAVLEAFLLALAYVSIHYRNKRLKI